MAMLLMQANGTVTICHSKTKSLSEISKRADILVCAVGKAVFNGRYGQARGGRVDVGMNIVDGRLCRRCGF